MVLEKGRESEKEGSRKKTDTNKKTRNVSDQTDDRWDTYRKLSQLILQNLFQMYVTLAMKHSLTDMKHFDGSHFNSCTP